MTWLCVCVCVRDCMCPLMPDSLSLSKELLDKKYGLNLMVTVSGGGGHHDDMLLGL